MVNLTAVVLETVLRGGVPLEANLMRAYGAEQGYTGVYGMSVVMHPGWNVDQLARVAHLPHPKISFATVNQLQVVLGAAGYDLTLVPTPLAGGPDHHTMGVARQGQVLHSLPLDAAQAMARAFATIPNPHRQP